MTQGVFRRGRPLAAAAFLVLLLLTGRANALPLNLVPVSNGPDISAFFLTFTFDSSGGVCGAGADMTLCYSSDAAAISSVGLTPDITDIVPYQLIAAVDPLTGLLTAAGGSFSMGSYLTGTVSAFGYTLAGGAAQLEFLVDITGGSLASAFGPTLGINGAIFDWGPAGFGADPFTVTSADAFNDNFTPIPEPATLCLLGLGLFAVSAARWRRHGRAL